jgi:thiamine monophosphate kinase
MGIGDACNTCNTFVIGGDTNFGNELILTGTAIGTLKNNHFNSRLGSSEGDSLFVSGYAGSGNMFAFLKLLSDKNMNYKYQPTAQIREGLLLTNFNSCCIDSSDGILAAVDQLMRLNNIGFAFDNFWQSSISESDRRLADKYKLPLWFLLAGIHGEFKLVFTVPSEQEILFRKEADSIGWQPIKLGKVIRDRKITMPVYGRIREIKTGLIRNAGFNSINSLTSYLKLLKDIDRSLK